MNTLEMISLMRSLITIALAVRRRYTILNNYISLVIVVYTISCKLQEKM